MNADSQGNGLDVPSTEQVDLAIEMFRMLADATRVRILWALLQGEHSVSHLAEVVKANAPAVSQHLAKLRLARLVRQRREGTRIFYTADSAHVQQLLREALYHADHVVQGLPDHDVGP